VHNGFEEDNSLEVETTLRVDRGLVLMAVYLDSLEPIKASLEKSPLLSTPSLSYHRFPPPITQSVSQPMPLRHASSSYRPSLPQFKKSVNRTVTHTFSHLIPSRIVTQSVSETVTKTVSELSLKTLTKPSPKPSTKCSSKLSPLTSRFHQDSLHQNHALLSNTNATYLVPGNIGGRTESIITNSTSKLREIRNHKAEEISNQKLKLISHEEHLAKQRLKVQLVLSPSHETLDMT